MPERRFIGNDARGKANAFASTVGGKVGSPGNGIFIVSWNVGGSPSTAQLAAVPPSRATATTGFSTPTTPFTATSGLTPTTTTQPTNLTTPAQKKQISGMLDKWGLKSLAKIAVKYLDAGYTESYILEYILPNTKEYKERFPQLAYVNEKLGIPMNEGQYLATEFQYKDAVKKAGLNIETLFGKGNESKFVQNLFKENISVEELTNRINTVTTFINSANQDVVNQFGRFYGISKSDLASYYLNPSVGKEELMKKTTAAQLGVTAAQSGLGIGKNYAEGMVEGILSGGFNQSVESISEGFQRAGEIQEEVTMLSGIEGAGLTTKDLIESQIGNNPGAAKQVRGLASRERARFKGSGAGTQALGDSMSGQY